MTTHLRISPSLFDLLFGVLEQDVSQKIIGRGYYLSDLVVQSFLKKMYKEALESSNTNDIFFIQIVCLLVILNKHDSCPEVKSSFFNLLKKTEFVGLHDEKKTVIKLLEKKTDIEAECITILFEQIQGENRDLYHALIQYMHEYLGNNHWSLGRILAHEKVCGIFIITYWCQISPLFLKNDPRVNELQLVYKYANVIYGTSRDFCHKHPQVFNHIRKVVYQLYTVCKDDSTKDLLENIQSLCCSLNYGRDIRKKGKGVVHDVRDAEKIKELML